MALTFLHTYRYLLTGLLMMRMTRILGYGLLVPAGLWSMCWSLCPHESVTPNACSWRSLLKMLKLTANAARGLSRRVLLLNEEEYGVGVFAPGEWKAGELVNSSRNRPEVRPNLRMDRKLQILHEFQGRLMVVSPLFVAIDCADTFTWWDYDPNAAHGDTN
jgi:hypothetical protein